MSPVVPGAARLATRVRLVGSERAGRIEIVYTSAEDLERLTELITGRRG